MFLSKVLFLLPLLIPAPAPLSGPPRARSLLLRSVQSGGIRRWYRVHVPPTYDPGTPIPVVLAYHGGGGNAREFLQNTALDQSSDLHGFLLVLPEGTGALGGPPLFRLETWNAGNCCGWAVQHQVDDVQFTRDLLDAVEAEWNVDTHRIFATGHSNGAMLCYRLGVELADRIAAIGPNAGTLEVDLLPPIPIPLIAFHGKLDCHVPFQGGHDCGITNTDYRSQRDTLSVFVQVDRAQVPHPLVPAEVRGQAQRFEAPAPMTGADVRYWWLLDGGHSWPGHGSTFPPNEPTNMDIDANEELWAFFSAHPR